MKINRKKSIKSSSGRAIKAYSGDYAEMGYEGLDEAVEAVNNLIANLKDLLNDVEEFTSEYDEWSDDTRYAVSALEMFVGPDDAYAFAESVGDISDTVAQCQRDFNRARYDR